MATYAPASYQLPKLVCRLGPQVPSQRCFHKATTNSNWAVLDRRAFCATSAAVAGAVAAITRSRHPRSVCQRWPRPLAIQAESDTSEPTPSSDTSKTDPGRIALVVQRLTTAENSLRRWGYVAEAVYTWLGIISLGVACFAAYTKGGARAFAGSPSMALGLGSVGLSVLCSFIGWLQARGCRNIGRRCGIAASSLEPGGPARPETQIIAMMPALGDIECSLRNRQRTAWLGAMFAVVGLQAMVGLLVGKVLAASGGLAPAPGVSLDVFTLLAVSNVALSHVIGGGTVALQQGALPTPAASTSDVFRGWARQ